MSSTPAPLLPERHPTGDFFVCDIFDAAPKGDMASMEHPLFSLSTRPDFREHRYEHDGTFVEIKPSTAGLATIHDRDILIYCISQLIAAQNHGQPTSKTLRFRAYDLLKATNRMTNGQAYEGLKAALERLRGTTISTNINTGGEEQLDIFGLIDSAKIVRQSREGRMQEVEVQLSDWVFNAIKANEVLTLHRDYFRLRKPVERRIYELARKHCGPQRSFRVRLEVLQKKCGSTASTREFRRMIRAIAEADGDHDHFPDYSVRLDEKDMVRFTNKASIKIPGVAPSSGLALDPEVYQEARLAAPGWDIYVIEQEWRNWMAMGDLPPPKNPELAFLGFCRKWAERNS